MVSPKTECYVIDPIGSAVFDYVRTGEIEQEKNQFGFDTTFITRSQGKSITEGIGIEYLTTNIKMSVLDGAM